MLITVLKSKIHMATITDTKLYYEGSIEIDENLLNASGIIPGELVMVVNFNSGKRFETYTIPGKKGAGKIGLRGPAAKMGKKGDMIIIASYALVDGLEARKLKPKIVHVDRKNRIKPACR
ncbi:MAG: aspartate 1-decarboxylase [Candidatus Saganbacteria bacterium]|nr:aspartate 1-decarboxylase [Candidatus Saganbacteria bacterium]